MSRPPATSRKLRRVLVLLALFLLCLRAVQTARALLGAEAVPFPRSVPPGIWARNLLVARRAKVDGTLDRGEAEGNENDKGPREDDNENKDEQLQENKEAPAKESELTFKNYDEQMVGKLRELCRARGLPSNGTKAELKAALAKDDEERRPVEAKAASAAVPTGVPVRQRRIWLQQEGNPYSVFLDMDAIVDDLRHLATPDVSDRQRANVKLLKSDGTELDLDGKVPLDAGSSSKSPVRVEGAPSSEFQAIKTVSEKDLQNLANISEPNVTIEDWMVGLGRCGKECLKDIQTFAPKSDSPVDRVPPLMLSRCMRGGKTTFLVYLFKLVKAEPGYLPIFISFNGFFGIQRKRGESRLQTILRAIAVTLLPATPTDTQSVSCDEDTLCDHLERQNGIIVLMIDELNLLVPKGTTDNEVASFLRRVFLSRENRYLVFTTHEPFDGSQMLEYKGAYSPRDVIARDLPRSVNVTEQRGIPQCRALSAGNVLFFSGIPALLRSWKQQYSFQARFQQLTKPKKTPGLLESFVREFLDGQRQRGDAIRAFDCLTATSDQGDAKWILCYAAQMCSYLNQLELADWINRLQTDASDPLSGKGWEVLVVLAVAFRCLEAMARGHAGHPLLGLPPKPNIQECYFWDVPPEVSTLDEALEWWARQDIPPTFPFVAVLNPLCSTFEMFDCILLYQRQELGVRHVRGFQQKAGRTYPDKAARQDVDSVWMQGKATENRRSKQNLNWTLPSAGEIREFLGASLRDLFPKELDT